MFQKITRRHLDKFVAAHATDERMLDIGSGSAPYAKHYPNRVSLDINPDKEPDVVGDAHNLPFGGDSFAVVLCTDVLCTEMLEHVKEPRKVISEIHRVLQKGGRVLLTTRFVYPIHNSPDDYWRFTKYGLMELFDDEHWEVLELIAETKSFSTIGVLLQHIVLQSRLWLNKPLKLGIIVVSWIFDHSSFLIREEYSDIRKSMSEKEIMPSGYYVVARKR